MIITAYKGFQELERYRLALGKILEDIAYHRRFKGSPYGPLARRIFEQSRLLLSNGLHAKDYYVYGLFRSDLSWIKKQSFLGSYGTKPLFTLLNGQGYQSVLDDKVLFTRCFEGTRLPTPEILCALGRHAQVDNLTCLHTRDEVARWFADPSRENLFLKPSDAQAGKGAMSLGKRIGGRDAWAKMPSGEEVGIEEIWAHVESWTNKGTYLIVQDRLEPHPDLAAVVPNVLNTVRVITRFENGEAKVLDAVLRMGRAHSATDNFSGGGFIVPLDLATGVCRQPLPIEDGLVQPRDNHPDSGQRLTGVTLPNWPRVLELARLAQQRCSFHQTLGWDIGLSAQGPVLIEGNWWYTASLHQMGRDQGLLATEWCDMLTRPQHYRYIGLGLGQAWRRGYPDKVSLGSGSAAST
ncbi:MAG: sugar-transfer associated ATP-grasp domain-containing protein [Pseudomonadota bacterium]